MSGRRHLASFVSARAFTLIEILVVILVLGVLIAVAAPSFLGQIEKAQVSAAQQQLSVAYKAAKAATVRVDNQGDFIAPGFDHQALADAIGDSEPGFTTAVADQGQNEDSDFIAVDAAGSDATTASRLVLHNQSKSEEFRYCTLDTVGPGQPLNVYCNDTGVPAPSLDGPSTPEVTDTLGNPPSAVQEGMTLSVDEGDWFDATEFDYQWQVSFSPWADIAAVDGGTSENYIVRTADIGGTLRVCVTAMGVGGQTVACSAAVPASGTVLPNPPVQSGTGPQITGLAQVGQTLTVSNGTWSSSQTLTYARQWLSCASATDLNSCTNVGADQATYVVGASDIGNFIRARITATDTYNQSMVAYANATTAVISAVPVGVVLPYAGTGTPAGWLEADGAAVNRSTYSALFAELGTAYGAGDGSTTFNLPNLQGRVPLGTGSGISRGASGGALDQSGSLNPWGAINLSFAWTETPSTPSPIAHAHSSTTQSYSGFWAGTWFNWVNKTVTLASNNQSFSVGNASLTASGSITPSASYSVSNAPYRVVRYLVAASPSVTTPCGALWGYGGAAAPANAQLADGAAATGTLSACLDGAFAGTAPDLKGRFPLGKTAAGTGSTLAAGIGALDQTVSSSLNTASTQGNVTGSTGTAALTASSHTHSVSYSTFSNMSNGGDVNHAVDSVPSVGANSNAGATYNATYSPGTLSASGSGAQAPSSGVFHAPFQAINWVAYTTSGYTPAIGTITPFAGQTVPVRWLAADGACYSTSTYADLFAVFAYSYGGSGASFCLPDLRSKAPLGKAAAGTGSTLGETGGALNPSPSLSFNGWTPSVTVPAHNYSWNVPGHSHLIGSWSGATAASSGGGGGLDTRSVDAATSSTDGGGTAVGSVAGATRNGTAIAATTASPAVSPAPYLGVTMMVYAGQ